MVARNEEDVSESAALNGQPLEKLFKVGVYVMVSAIVADRIAREKQYFSRRNGHIGMEAVSVAQRHKTDHMYARIFSDSDTIRHLRNPEYQIGEPLPRLSPVSFTAQRVQAPKTVI